MKCFLTELFCKVFILGLIVIGVLLAAEHKKKDDLRKHRLYVKCVKEKKMNEVMCSLWSQFHIEESE